jgi:hypothetical protein
MYIINPCPLKIMNPFPYLYYVGQLCECEMSEVHSFKPTYKALGVRIPGIKNTPQD